MIGEEQIGKLANRQQTTELNIRREYCQHLFLSYFYQQKEAAGVYFKGGTALRIIYKSPRFSEDLDFSSKLTDTKVLEKIILQTLEEVEREAIETEILEAKETTGGYLAEVLFRAFEQKIALKIEISLREGELRGEVITIASDFMPSYIVIQLGQESLAEEKIEALLSRAKPRDFYDLYFMLRANILLPERKVILARVLKVLEKTEINFELELKQLLPKSHWAVIRDFRQNLEREIKRFV